MRTWVPAVVTAIALTGPPAVWAESPPFETPASKDFYLLEPFASHMSFNGRAELTAQHQHYQPCIYRDEQLTCWPTCTLGAVAEALEGCGVLFLATHGSEGALVVEAYEKSPEGLARRDQAFQAYRDAGWLEGYIVATDMSFAYGISITGFGILSRFNDRNTIVYLGACHSCTVQFGFQDARDLLCYDNSIAIARVIQDADLFWYHMDGSVCRVCRTVRVAFSEVWDLLRHAVSPPGDQTTVLSPSVCDASLDDGGHVRTWAREWFAFDTRMDVTDARVLETLGPVMVGDEAWANDTCLVFEIAPYDRGVCTISVSAAAVSDGGMMLDGNTDPPGSIARGPSGDPYSLTLYALADNPATRWGGLWAFASDEGIRVEWTTETERGSHHFEVSGIVEGGERVLAEVPARGHSTHGCSYSVVVPFGPEWFFVAEVDTAGSVARSRPFPLEEQAPRHRPSLENLEALAAGGAAPAPAGACTRRAGRMSDKGQGRGTQEWPEYVFYGPDSLLAEVSPLIALWSQEGIAARRHSSTGDDP